MALDWENCLFISVPCIVTLFSCSLGSRQSPLQVIHISTRCARQFDQTVKAKKEKKRKAMYKVKKITFLSFSSQGQKSNQILDHTYQGKTIIPA